MRPSWVRRDTPLFSRSGMSLFFTRPALFDDDAEVRDCEVVARSFSEFFARRCAEPAVLCASNSGSLMSCSSRFSPS